MRAPVGIDPRHGLHIVWSQDELHKRTLIQRFAAHWWRRLLAVALALSVGAAVAFVAGALLTEQALHPPRRAVTPDDRARARAIAAGAGARLTDVPLIVHDGAVLSAWSFSRPEPARGTVVTLHGLGDARPSQLMLAELLLADGYRVLAPDLRAHGTSGGGLVTAGLEEHADLAAWAEWSRQQHPNECVFAAGTSLGGATVLQTLALEPFCAAVVEAPFASARSMAFYWLGEGVPLRARWMLFGPVVQAGFLYASWARGLRLQSADAVPTVRVSRVPLLLIDDERDDAVPRRDVERLHASNPAHVQVWTVPGARHAQALLTAPEEYRRRVLRFLAEHQ